MEPTLISERLADNCECFERMWQVAVPPNVSLYGRNMRDSTVKQVQYLRISQAHYEPHDDQGYKETTVAGWNPQLQKTTGDLVYHTQQLLSPDEIMWTLFGIVPTTTTTTTTTATKNEE